MSSPPAAASRPDPELVMQQVLADADRWFAARALDGGPTTRLLRPRPSTFEAKRVAVGYENEVAEWCGGHPQYGYGVIVITDTGQPVIAGYGDWIVRGPRRTYRVVSDGELAADFEPVVSVVTE